MVAQWTFLTNHSHVLICVWRNPRLKVREIADLVGITERSAQRILRELVEYGVLQSRKEGRRNVYQVNPDMSLRHPVERDQTVRDLLGFISQQDSAANNGDS
ncbi:winged helix-turn-helix domain-containing protein [Kamptonema cortianum]|nr:winged helix-turn-helix domain-containing protein [Geitlerinema splendidum]MDK3157097.1 winged helix-turn-helix domain-containing protein [Kamptonema cortianum]